MTSLCHVRILDLRDVCQRDRRDCEWYVCHPPKHYSLEKGNVDLVLTRFFCSTAIVAGWGNLGAGVTNLVIGSILYPTFVAIFDGDTEKAWRTVCVVPAVVAFTTGIVA